MSDPITPAHSVELIRESEQERELMRKSVEAAEVGMAKAAAIVAPRGQLASEPSGLDVDRACE